MPYTPWSYLLLAVVVGVVAWLFFGRRKETKGTGKASETGEEQIAAKLTGNALLLLQRLIVAGGKPREFQTLKLVLAGQTNEDQAAQQALELLVSTGCAAKAGTQYRATPRGERLWKNIQAKKRGGK